MSSRERGSSFVEVTPRFFNFWAPGDEPVFKRGNGFVVLGYRLVQALAREEK